MAILKMKKLRLVGVSYERQKLLDALADTGAVQIRCTEETWANAEANETVLGFMAQAERVFRAIEFVESIAQKNVKGFSAKNQPIDVDFESFLTVLDNFDVLEKIVEDIERLSADLAQNSQEVIKTKAKLEQLKGFLLADVPFCEIKNTKNTVMFFGTFASESFVKLEEYVKTDCPLTTLKKLNETENGAVVFVVCHFSERDLIASKLSELNFVRCPFDYSVTPSQKVAELKIEKSNLEKEETRITNEILTYIDKLDELKIFCDRINFEKQKSAYSVGFENTTTTFSLQAYCPEVAVAQVRDKINLTTDAVFFTFDEVEDSDECVPTLMQNNAVVKQFEFVTNMYSPPAYKEFDPNLIVSIFFSLFFGFIMADIGYGILLALGGFILASKMKRDTGIRRLIYIIAIGGIFTIIFGALFGSFFGINNSVKGFEWLPKAVIPDPVKNSSEVLMYSLLIGAVHLCFAYISMGLTCIKQGRAWDGIWDGFMWALFFAGLVLLFPAGAQMLFGISIFGLEKIPPLLNTIGASICIGVVVIEIFASGRHAKGFGKAVKGFTAVYGLINFFSDLLSYARLFGLMLSGAMIASIVSEMSLNIMQSGVFGVVGGILIMLIGHGFNIAMGVLGAYVHNARLQFIEYFGKFYEGNGELFAPIGSNLSYTQFVAKDKPAIK